jgi:excisionase family DNA binding protein
VRDAALATSLSEYEVRQLINEGTLPARRHGRRILVDYSALEEWYRSRPRVVEPHN